MELGEFIVGQIDCCKAMFSKRLGDFYTLFAVVGGEPDENVRFLLIRNAVVEFGHVALTDDLAQSFEAAALLGDRDREQHLAFLAYLGAVALGLSGVFATAAAAMVLRRLVGVGERDLLAVEVDGFWRATAFVANAFIFLLTGLSVSLERIAYEPLLVAVTIGAALLSRAVLALLVIRRRSWQVAVLLAGMRGGLSLALALSLPADVPQRGPIVDAVFGLVLFTLVIQGLALEPVVKRLRLE
jgi:hypothetical protein